MDNIIPLFGHARPEIRVVKPVSMEEAQQAIDQLKGGQLIMCNVSELPIQLAQRIIDFLSGSVNILSGEVVKVGSGIFLYSLSEIEVAGFQEPQSA
ncbi:cell division protein SepF [Acaryochloris sp. IP29b_bin.148]|uniref:cell division protein SepF n=1 Tax=Acaryochloris sp. IP29b_bin.148 TaxID=2969218 RepID=UPI00262376B7|nr:cell division protein SepF [Acaryochloris sp. IP29b_bin.148]